MTILWFVYRSIWGHRDWRKKRSEKIHQVITFHAYISHEVYLRAGRRIIFDVTKTNQGSGYNIHTAVFTSPSKIRTPRICLGYPIVYGPLFDSADDKTFRLRIHIPTYKSQKRHSCIKVKVFISGTIQQMPEMAEYTLTFKLNQHFRVDYFSTLLLFLINALWNTLCLFILSFLRIWLVPIGITLSRKKKKICTLKS